MSTRWTDLEPSRSTAYIGSPMCPHIQSVRNYMAELKGTIVTSTAQLKQPDVPVEVAKKEVIHDINAYVLYTYAGVTIGGCIDRPAAVSPVPTKSTRMAS